METAIEATTEPLAINLKCKALRTERLTSDVVYDKVEKVWVDETEFYW